MAFPHVQCPDTVAVHSFLFLYLCKYSQSCMLLLLPPGMPLIHCCLVACCSLSVEHMTFHYRSFFPLVWGCLLNLFLGFLLVVRLLCTDSRKFLIVIDASWMPPRWSVVAERFEENTAQHHTWITPGSTMMFKDVAHQILAP